MEEDFGLNQLSEVEKNVLYAVKDLEKEYGTAKTGNLLSHEFTSKMSRISVFRSLKTLEKLQKNKAKIFKAWRIYSNIKKLILNLFCKPILAVVESYFFE